MKFILKYALFFFFICGKSFAQSDDASKVILNALSKNFKSNDVIKIDFNITAYNPEIKSKESQNGILYLKSKVNKYKIIFDNQEILSDGKNQWTFLKADNEVQLSLVSNDDNSLNPAQLFTSYNKGFKYKYNGETKIGTKVYQNIELAPLTNRSFFKIKMAINKSKNQILSLSVFEKNGNIYTYIVKNLIPVKGISDSFFIWDKKKYPNVDLQDLR